MARQAKQTARAVQAAGARPNGFCPPGRHPSEAAAPTTSGVKTHYSAILFSVRSVPTLLGTISPAEDFAL